MATQMLSNWTLEILQPGKDSSVTTNCASISIRNTSTTKVLYLAPRNSTYRLPVAPGGSWGIDLASAQDELVTVVEVYTAQHDAAVIVERIFKQVA